MQDLGKYLNFRDWKAKGIFKEVIEKEDYVEIKKEKKIEKSVHFSKLWGSRN